MSDLTPKEYLGLDIAMTRLGQLVDRMEKASHRERTLFDRETEVAQLRAEIERLRGLLGECEDVLDCILQPTRMLRDIKNRVREALGE